jgi:hypothetical protein
VGRNFVVGKETVLTSLLDSIALAFQNLTPNQVCQAFSRALERPCHFIFDPKIHIQVPIPAGYREQLAGIEVLFGQMHAPYFPGPEFDFVDRRSIPDGKGKATPTKKLTDEARGLWEGYRSMEEYAREVFPVEEEANGRNWMNKVDKKVT